MESREEKESQGKILWKIFISTLYLSAFTFGGGYVIVTLMKKKFVDEYHWIGEDEMLDLVAIAQSSPGAIAVNGAIVVGYKLAGIPGALVAILGTILPPFVIIAAISVCYNVFRSNFFVAQMLSGMQAGVGAVIASVTYDMGAPIVKEKDPMSLVIMLGAFLAACILEINVVYIVIVCGYAAMPLIQGQVVTTHGWLTMSEFTDLITISQITPGPIAVNSATFVGLKIAGIPGAVVATVGCILPSCIIVTILARLYLKYRNLDLLQGVLKSLRPAVVAMIASAGILILKNAFWGSAESISLTGTEWSMVVIFGICVLLLRKTKLNPIWVMVLAGVMKVGISAMTNVL